jgi:hypothetical protein
MDNAYHGGPAKLHRFLASNDVGQGALGGSAGGVTWASGAHASISA